MSGNNETALAYGNFQNPFGLVYRMLKSGRRAAWAALFREALGIAAKPIDFVLQFKERSTIERSKTDDTPLLLIVGPPRCGTTLVYQVMSYCLDVSYPTNLSSVFPRSPITVNGLAGKVRADFQSFYGQTARMSGPNDAFHLWNRWLGEDRYLTKTDLSKDKLDDMRRFFGAWSQSFGKPILNKNNRNVHCTDYLASALPQSWFIGVFRDPVCVARSLIHARQTVQGDRKIGWGLQCQESHCHNQDLGYVQDVCDQVRLNHADLKMQLDGLNQDRVIRIQYESFCNDPDRCVDQVIAQIPGLKLRTDVARLGARAFSVSLSEPLSDAEEQILRQNFDTAESVLACV